MNQKKILIVDDDKQLSLGLAIRLKANGYDIVSAPDALTAVSVATKERPDLILLDLGLPAGGGVSVLQRVNSIVTLVGTPIIVLTAKDATTYKESLMQAGACEFFQKPADNDELLAAIRRALRQPGDVTETDSHSSVPQCLNSEG